MARLSRDLPHANVLAKIQPSKPYNNLLCQHRNTLVIAPLFAADPIVYVGVAVVFSVLIFLGFISLMMKQYKRCPSNRLMVIYGKAGSDGQTQRVIHGGAVFVWPLIQDYSYLSLDPIQVEVKLEDVVSIDNIRANMSGVFTVAVSTDEHVMQNAATRLLGLPRREIETQASEIIVAQFRSAIASMTIDEINRARDKFLARLGRSLEPALSKIGLQLINVNVNDATDQSSYIDAEGEKVETVVLLGKLLAVFNIPAQQLLTHLIEEGKLSDKDRKEIRKLLDAPGSSP